jgi:hypothetical protein
VSKSSFKRRPTGPILGIALLVLTSAPALAGTVLFQGTFTSDNAVALFDFTANSPEAITVQTYGYGGSTGSPTIASGGFAPTAFIFDNLGDVLTLTNGTCGQVSQDPTTLNCDDLFYQNTFGPGTFTLALAVYDNSPVDTTLTDGFIQDSNPGFTCQEAGASGDFCDVTTAVGTSRTGDYAISISGADSVSQTVGTPEPGSGLLLLAGGVLTLLRRQRFTIARL